jgi:peptidoglycan/LPS O-acetylase OafA/YrhL
VHISFIIQHIAVPILYGVLLAHALNNRAMFKLLHGVLCSSYAVLMLAILTLYMLAFYTSHPVYLLLSMTLLIASAILSKPSFILNNRLSLMIGKYSYGMYLFHMLCINIVRKIDQTMHLPDFVELMLIIILTVVVAHISYHAFEKRFIQLKRFYQ